MASLPEQIEIEKESIVSTLKYLDTVLAREDKTVIELAAIATFIQNVYGGVENILKRILRYKKINISFDDSWHKNILSLSAKHKIISKDVFERLDEYRAFRHFFVHSYSFTLNESKLLPLANNLKEAWSSFEVEIDQYLKSQ